MSSRSLIGQTVGKYQVTEILGRGGMAEVYKAYQETLDRNVAIKVMHSFLADEQGFLGRFQREARAMAALNHPSIVGVYDFDVFDDVYYIVMEYVSGGTLKQRIESASGLGDSMPLSASTRVVLEVADALAYAHGRGMVHRDIKPGNIMLTDEGRAVLTDFGIAKILSGPTFTATGAMVGTPAYMSPEQGLGQPGDERSDLYALGVLYYQMATGRLPYDADTPLAVILKHVNEPVPLPTDFNDDIPGAIQAVIVKAMAKDPGERYQSANEMIQELQEAAKVGDLDLAAAAFITGAERMTPPPPVRPTEPVDATQLAPAAASATVLGSAAAAPADATRMVPAQDPGLTEVAVPPPTPAAPVVERKRSRLGIILILLLLLIIAAGVGGYFIFAGSDGATPGSDDALVAVAATETPSPEPSATPTVEPQDTVDIGATAVAVIAATLTAEPTKTLLPSATVLPSATPLPDLTVAFVASCEPEIALVNSYTFQNEASSSTPVDVNFVMNWVLTNDSACPVEAGAEWAFVEGEDFGQSGPVVVDDLFLEGDETTLTIELRAPSSPGRYESTWQLLDASGSPLGPPQTFEVSTFEPQTPTPQHTATPEATATSEVVEQFGRNLSVVNCEYADSDWKCDLIIHPYGGRAPYIATVSDLVYEGDGPFTHTILWGRCSAWVNDVSVQDATGQTISQAEYYDPHNLFPGGCTPPGSPN
jgi:tRNA A-37 threonylcarbamoyl transferase component Bud32/flagellar basal body-associated protein FliL